MMTNQGLMSYHKPVLLDEAINGLAIKSDGIYVDATYGAGGHSKKILENLDANGKLFAFDCDADAKRNITPYPALNFIDTNYRYISAQLKNYKVYQIDGILADFGTSWHQIDTSERGFSFRSEGRLDMRLNQNQSLTAYHVVNHYDTKSLSKVFYEYGELRNAPKIVDRIESHRESKKIRTTTELKTVLQPILSKRYEHKILAKIFQAIRIEVNNELESIKELLKQSVFLMKPGGRLVCISYHSLEDRLVKYFFNTGTFSNTPVKDFHGNELKPFKKVGKFIRPSDQEIESNNRARSAKLRIAEKL